MEKNLIERLESAVTRLEAISIGSRPSNSFANLTNEPADASIAAFDDLITQFAGKVVHHAEKIGGQVLEVTQIVEEAFSVQKELLIKIKQTKKPDIQGLAQFLKPLNEVISKANTLTEGKRSDFFNHLKTAADSLTALAWIAYTGKDCGMSLPVAHVEESWQMAEFYSNKVLVEFKSKDPNHVEWAKAMKDLYLLGLRDYVKNFYPLGPVWCPSGICVPTSTPSRSLGATGPAPPPPPPASLVTAESSGSSSCRAKEGMGAVFQEINSGSVTSGLRKVTDDMKTKNRKGRSGIVGTAENEARPSATSSKEGPSKFELQMGRKWVVEYQHGRRDLVIENCDAKQSVYAFGCKDSVLQVQGKVNNITLDKCSKMGIVFTDVVAACELVNCNSVEVQCQGSAPTISVDNTSGCQLYLSNDSLETSITTAKSSEINVLVPDSGPDGDWAEHALPQQYVHVFKDGQFVTSPVSHSGA